MKVSLQTPAQGVTIYHVHVANNEFQLSDFGGQLLSWTKGGVPVLFSNEEHAILDGKTPYRGGAPICFPYFGKGLLLPSDVPIAPQHGRARSSIWIAEVREADSSIVMRTEQPSPDGFGPSRFACELAYFFGEELRIEAKIVNVGDAETPFQLAIHTYWATEYPALTTVEGLGETYLDNLQNLKKTQDLASSHPHEPPFDRIYPDSLDTLQIHLGKHDVHVTTSGCNGTVLWNPGPNHGLADLGHPNFICVESGTITPAPVLKPGTDYRFKVTYKVDTRKI
jgi:D-hexose-6-phosphate mutarotase